MDIEVFASQPDPEHPGWLTWELSDTSRYNHQILGRLLIRPGDAGKAWVRMFPERRHSIANRCIAPGERTIFIAAEHAPKVPPPPLSSQWRTSPQGGRDSVEPVRAQSFQCQVSSPPSSRPIVLELVLVLSPKGGTRTRSHHHSPRHDSSSARVRVGVRVPRSPSVRLDLPPPRRSRHLPGRRAPPAPTQRQRRCSR